MTLQFRPAQFSDSERLLLWRNDPETRRNSFTDKPVELIEHEAWLRLILVHPERWLYITLENGRPVGSVRFDAFSEVCEMSWTVAPEARGRGVGKAMVSEALKLAPRALVQARTKPENEASARIAKAAGFQRTTISDTAVIWEIRRPNSQNLTA